MTKRGTVVLVVIGVIVGLLIGMGLSGKPKEAKAPVGYTIKITHSTGTYYAKDWRFDETHNCVVFVDQDQQRRVLCGDYNMENVKR